MQLTSFFVQLEQNAYRTKPNKNKTKSHIMDALIIHSVTRLFQFFLCNHCA